MYADSSSFVEQTELEQTHLLMTEEEESDDAIIVSGNTATLAKVHHAEELEVITFGPEESCTRIRTESNYKLPLAINPPTQIVIDPTAENMTSNRMSSYSTRCASQDQK